MVERYAIHIFDKQSIDRSDKHHTHIYKFTLNTLRHLFLIYERAFSKILASSLSNQDFVFLLFIVGSFIDFQYSQNTIKPNLTHVYGYIICVHINVLYYIFLLKIKINKENARFFFHSFI